MEYLDKEAAKPVPISTDHMEMVSSAARANTFKEIRQHLTSELTRAEQILADQQMEE